MPLNPNIPLSVRPLDVSPLEKLVTRKREDKRWDYQKDFAERKYKSQRQDKFTEAVQANEVESWIKANQSLKAGDVETARRIAMQRKQMLEEGGSQGFQVTTQETDAFLQMLDTDPQQALSLTEQAVEGLKRIKMFGSETDPRTTNIKEYERGLEDPSFQKYMESQGQGDRPSSVQEWEYFNQLPKAEQEQYLTMKRSNRLYDVGGGFTRVSPLTQQITPVMEKTLAPGERPDIRGQQAAASARGAQRGTSLGEDEALLESIEAQQPALKTVVSDLRELSKDATYTYAGQLADWVVRQSGLGATQGAVDRAEYMATVDNELLPLLRQTFGAQFTVKEGEWLRATLGDPNASPEEKNSQLDAFIKAKLSRISALKRRTGTESKIIKWGDM